MPAKKFSWEQATLVNSGESHHAFPISQNALWKKPKRCSLLFPHSNTCKFLVLFWNSSSWVTLTKDEKCWMLVLPVWHQCFHCCWSTLGMTCAIQDRLSMLVIFANLLFAVGLSTCSRHCRDSPTPSNKFLDVFLTCRLAPAPCCSLACSCIHVYIFATFIASTQWKSSMIEVEFPGLKEMSRRYQLSFGMSVGLVFARISTSRLTSLSVRWHRYPLV